MGRGHEDQRERVELGMSNVLGGAGRRGCCKMGSKGAKSAETGTFLRPLNMSALVFSSGAVESGQAGQGRSAVMHQ